MEDKTIKDLEWVFMQPNTPKELLAATTGVSIEHLPELLKQPVCQLDNRLKEWQKCADEISSLSKNLDEVNQKIKQTSELTEEFHSKLTQPKGLEKLAQLLSLSQNWHQLKDKQEMSLPIGTWQQKKAYLESSKKILQSHLKITVQNNLIERYQQLSKVRANLLAYNIQISQNDTLEELNTVLEEFDEKLNRRRHDDMTLTQLTELLPLYHQYKILLNKINESRKKINELLIESNKVLGKIQEREPLVAQHPTVLEIEQENFGSFTSANQYFSGLVSNALVKCNLMDKSVLLYQSVQRSIREFLVFKKEKEQLDSQCEKERKVLSTYLEQFEDLKLQLERKGLKDFSSHNLLEKTTNQLQIIDPEFNYTDINILLVNQRVDALKKIVPKEISDYELIIPELLKIKSEMTDFRAIREHHNITATNEELVQGYPWQSPIELSIEDTNSHLKHLTLTIQGIESLCLYETELGRAKQFIQESQVTRGQLQQELSEKQLSLKELESKVNEAHRASRKVAEQIKINLAKKALDSKQTNSSMKESGNEYLTSANLWQEYLLPLINSQSQDVKEWLIDCCNPDKKQSLSHEQKFQFDQLCHDIYMELKHIGVENNSTLSTYHALFNESGGLNKLLQLKPAIPLDIENQLPPLENKELNEALNQFNSLAQNEKGKIADVLKQTGYRLHYLAWQAELDGIKLEKLEELKNQFVNDPHFQCLVQSRHYESIIDWVCCIFQTIKRLFAQQENPIYLYGLFNKQPLYLDQVTNLSQSIAVSA